MLHKIIISPTKLFAKFHTCEVCGERKHSRNMVVKQCWNWAGCYEEWNCIECIDINKLAKDIIR